MRSTAYNETFEEGAASIMYKSQGSKQTNRRRNPVFDEMVKRIGQQGYKTSNKAVLPATRH